MKQLESKKPTILKENISEIVENAWLGIDNPLELKLDNELLHDAKEFGYDDPFLHYLGFFRNPRNFDSICRLIFNVQLLPFQLVILQELWSHPFPMLIASRGGGKSFLLALYSMLKAFINQGSKIVVAGAGFRQSKMLYEYCQTIWNRAPLLRQACSHYGSNQGPKNEVDRVVVRIGESTIIGVPVGTGATIRGLRATTLIGDEFSSHNEEVFENVLSGFASVSQNPVENVRLEARRKKLQELGLWSEKEEVLYQQKASNQTILAGTPYYEFNHFFKYWKKYKAIVESAGDPIRLREVFGDDTPLGFNWKDYCVIRVPHELLPPGFMDQKHISKAQATLPAHMFNMEYGGTFCSDSTGFFRRSLIESCVTKEPIILPSGPVQFHAITKGSRERRYVYGVDPASEQDNFSIVVLELHPDHRRIVYVWSINRRSHQARIQSNLTLEQDYYSYCARKIRELMHHFPVERIGIDSQGGGFALEEALHDMDKLREGELPLWRVINPDKEYPTDGNAGLHILEMINFSDSQWVSLSNTGMRKDFEDKVLLFPYFDPLSVGLAIEDDKRAGRKFDTLEDCILEIEDLKDELATIVHTQVGVTGRDRWDTPEQKLPGGKKGRQRKDRYSALLIANMVARTLQRAPDPIPYSPEGGFVDNISSKDMEGDLYTGPEWFVEKTRGLY